MSQLVRDNSGGDADGGDGVSPYPAQVVDEWVATSGPGEKKAVGWEWVLRAQQTETMDQFADEGIHRDHTFGFQLAERHMMAQVSGPTSRRQSKDKSAHSPMRMPV